MNLLKLRERDKKIEKLYHKAGMTLQEIATMYGITRERVSQILGRPTKQAVDNSVDKA